MVLGDETLYEYLQVHSKDLYETLGLTLLPDQPMCEVIESISRLKDDKIYFSISIISESIEDPRASDCLIHTFPFETIESAIDWLGNIKQISLPTRVRIFLNAFNLDEEGKGINCQTHFAEFEPHDRKIRIGGTWISEKAYLLNKLL